MVAQTVVTYRENLPSCWVYEKGKYEIAGDIFYKLKVYERKLPFVSIYFEEALKKAKVPYRKIAIGGKYEYLEYWNEEVYETEEISLPLYVAEDGIYKYAGIAYTGEIITQETSQKAFEMQKMVKPIVLSKKKEKFLQGWYEYAVNCLKQGCNDGERKVCIVVEPSRGYETEIDLELNKGTDSFKVLPVKDAKGRNIGLYGIFDMNKIFDKPENWHCLKIHVSAKIAGNVIGKEGGNKKRWEKALGVRAISVVVDNNY